MTRLMTRTIAATSLLLVGSLWTPAGNAESQPPPLLAGRATGASQLMIVDEGGVVTYDDTPLGICHLEIMADGALKTAFPDKALGRGKWHPVSLPRSATEPRVRWTKVINGDTYQATAIPYSRRAYVFRLEVYNGGKLVAGAQQFYALGPE